jgi:hypothetical protein
VAPVSAAVAAVLALAAAPAGAAFTAPVNLSLPGPIAPGVNVHGPQIATDADGDSVAVWVRYESDGSTFVEMRPISSAGVRGSTKKISDHSPFTDGAQIASDRDGDSVAVWERFGGTNWRVRARTISRTGAVGPLTTLSLSGEDAHTPQVATGATGHAVAVWERVDGSSRRVQARSISRSGILGSFKGLSAPGMNARNPQIASDADGDTVAVWESFAGDGSVGGPVQARTLSVAGVLGPIRTLSAGGENTAPQIASDADGDAVAVWQRFTGSGFVVQSRSISRSGVLGPIQDLSDHQAWLPQVATDADGDSFAVWQCLACPSGVEIQGRSISRSGVLGPVRDLSAFRTLAGDPQVATDADGHSVAVWQRFTGSSGFDVQARSISAAGVLGPIQDLSGPGAIDPQVASDADGDAVAVWDRLGGNFRQIQAALGP